MNMTDFEIVLLIVILSILLYLPLFLINGEKGKKK